MTTSNINYAAINENFPVAGQDNDTQVFRDNFDTIKTNFNYAKTEIQDLMDNVVRTDQDNDMNGNLVHNATFLNNVETIVPSEVTIVGGTIPVEFGSGSYQVFTVGANSTITLNGFPSAGTKLGKVTLELYSGTDATPYELTFSLSGTGATAIKKNNFPTVVGYDLAVSSNSNPVIIEIWRHSTDNFYMNYIGQFS